MRSTRVRIPIALAAIGVLLPASLAASPGAAVVEPVAPGNPPTSQAGPTDGSGLGAHELPVDVQITMRGARTALVVLHARDDVSAGTLSLFGYADGEDSRLASVEIPVLKTGDRVTRRLSLGQVRQGDLGLTATLSSDERAAGSAFLAVRSTRHGLVTAPTLGSLDEEQARLAFGSGRLGRARYEATLHRLHRVPGSTASQLETSTTAASAATVSGQAHYVDRLGNRQPVRNARIDLLTSSGSLSGTTRTSGLGAFTVQGVVGEAQRYVVRATADGPHASVMTPGRVQYFVESSSFDLSPGASVSGVGLNLVAGTEANGAFSILDAATTVGSFYTLHRRSGWDSGFSFQYPSGVTSSSADRSTRLISIAGGDTRCTQNDGTTGWCNEDAYDWDVVAHETGHVVAYQAGIADSSGGKHDVCADAWVDGLHHDLPVRTKHEGLRLAWSEGWATFWGMTALRTQSPPLGLPVETRDLEYDDLTGPPHNTGLSFDYDIEDNADCPASRDNPYTGGETSEMAVQKALWDMWDSSTDQGDTVDWTTDDMFARLWDADAVTLPAALDALSSGRTATEQDALAHVLGAHRIAPSAITATKKDINDPCPPPVDWRGAGPMVAGSHRFTLRVRTTSGTVLASRVIDNTAVLGNVSQYQFTYDEWRSFSRYGTVVVDVREHRDSQPATSYLSGPVTIQPRMTGTGACWSFQPWESGFSAAAQARELPADQIDFAGHPLDATFDINGRVWGIGEFAMQMVQVNAAGTGITKHNVPQKYYLKDGQLFDWTKPHNTWFKDPAVAPPTGGYASSSDLGEVIIRAGGSVWAAQGGEQDHTANHNNHSILTRYDAANPANACAMPLPGDNNEVIGLAYDSLNDRVWFAESEGDHLQASTRPYATLGWIKASGLGSRCQNSLDYGGDPRYSAEKDRRLQDEAKSVLNSLQCTAAQESDVNANCVHIIKGTQLPSGAAHLEFDAGQNALWLTNWWDGKLRRYNIASGTYDTFTPPAGNTSMPVAWQIEANGTHVYFNEYMGNRILRFTKSTGAWSEVRIPYGLDRQTHSIALDGNRLWFTVSDENYDAATAIGYIDLASWTGPAKGVIYTGWSSLSMHPNAKPGNTHSFRGIEVNGSRLAVADHGDMAYVTLTKR